MEKSDMQLKRDVTEELAWDPTLDAARIGVEVHSGIVTLSGHIETYGQKLAAEKAAQRVSGVKALVMSLDVDLLDKNVCSDERIAVTAKSALAAHVQVPDDIRIKVDDGWITLTGSVDWAFQRQAAHDAVQHIAGLRGVTDWISIRAAPTAGDVRARILASMRRQVQEDADKIDVVVSADTVTLRGTARSLDEVSLARTAAWSAPGITKVINELQVG